MDRVLTAILNIQWYLLPLELQRHVLLVILRAQNPTILMTGTVPLNMETFSDVNIMNNKTINSLCCNTFRLRS